MKTYIQNTLYPITRYTGFMQTNIRQTIMLYVITTFYNFAL